MGNKIHGETRIVLRNPISGNILKDVTSENTFQSGVVQQYMRSLGRSGCRLRSNPIGSTTYEYEEGYSWHNILGGILLFRDQIQVGDLYMNAGNQMIGNGAYGFSNSEVPNEMGSYNAQESSESLSAVTQVYDFATNQANGRISCVCLTSRCGGYMGYGNPSGGKITASKLKSMQDYTEIITFGSGHTFRNNTQFTFSYSSPILTVTKKYIPATQCSLKSGKTETKTFDLSQLLAHYQSDIQLRITTQDGKYAYISFYTNSQYTLAPNTTGYYIKYDMDTDTLAEGSFTNPTSVRLAWGMDGVSFANGMLCVRSDTNPVKIELFDATSGVHINEIEGVSRISLLTSTGLNIMQLNDSDDNRVYVYDKVNDTMYPTNVRWDQSYGAGKYPTLDESTNAIIYRGYGDNMSIYPNPLGLATINNLQSAVTKTAAQTMKVTYTLTEA